MSRATEQDEEQSSMEEEEEQSNEEVEKKPYLILPFMGEKGEKVLKVLKKKILEKI